MSANKYIPIFGFVVAVVLAISTTPASGNSGIYAKYENKSHNLVVGYRMPGDRLVVQESIVKNSAWLRIVTVEKTFNTTKRERITLVEALDQKTNGNGAYASITQGGPGQENVTLRFKSQRGHGINFIVRIYSRP